MSRPSATAVLGKGVVPLQGHAQLHRQPHRLVRLRRRPSQAMQDLDLTIEEVDALTGPAIGRAKSATFRTADIAGVDVCVKVLRRTSTTRCPTTPSASVFSVPDFMTDDGRARLAGREGGRRLLHGRTASEILALDWKTLEYRAARRSRSSPRWRPAQTVADLGARLRADPGRQGQGRRSSSWRVLSATCLYAASLVPEISDDVVSVDRAMEWGYGWGLGPFRLLDALGVRRSPSGAARGGPRRPAARRAPAGLGPAATLLRDGRDGATTMFGPAGAVPAARPAGRPRPGRGQGRRRPAQEERRRPPRRPGRRLRPRGVPLQDERARPGHLRHARRPRSKEARAHFDALVVGNQGEHFTVGRQPHARPPGRPGGGVGRARPRRSASSRTRTWPSSTPSVPVVAAPFGLALGGGCEISLHAARVQASAETYMGLVEVASASFPAGGGTKELALRAHDRCAGVEGADAFPFIKRAFDLIAFAKVSTSGAEAQRLFLTPADAPLPQPRPADRRRQAGGPGPRPRRLPPRPAPHRRPVLGRPALATFKMGIHNAQRGRPDQRARRARRPPRSPRSCAAATAPRASPASSTTWTSSARPSCPSSARRRPGSASQHMLKEGKPLRN